MKLSIMVPSHSTGPQVLSNILNVCAMATDDIEVIVRDNSENPEKQDFLSRINEKNCRIIIAKECPGLENHRRLLDEAQSDFVYEMADDDYANGHALPQICAEIDRIRDNPDIVGTTGTFIAESTKACHIVGFNKFDDPLPLQRFKGFIKTPCFSLFHYSPFRRKALKQVWDFMATFPVSLSYNDVIMNCLTLMHGRMTFINRFTYHYNLTNWGSDQACFNTEALYFRKNGLDESGARIIWLIAAFEGARVMVDKYQGVDLSRQQRQELAMCLITHWYETFLQTCHMKSDKGKFDRQAQRIAQKWRRTRELKFDILLNDIVDYFALSSPEIAQRYYDFWR